MSDTSDTIDFSQKIFAIIEQGSKSATYKYAVLLGLLELCCEHHDSHGTPPEAVTTDQLARKVLRLYWPQSMPFGSTGKPLCQFSNKSRQAKIISLIQNARAAAPEEASPHRFSARHPDDYETLVRAIEMKLAEDPLPRLQTVPGLDGRFIYEIWWGPNVKSREFRSGSNQIYFIQGAQHHLVRLQGLLRPLLEQEWTRWVSANTGIQDELGRYLFPESRAAVAGLREPLHELQVGRCFYCERRIHARSAAVDHFLPWSRTHNDNLGNLVLAHRKCNAKKSAHFAATGHLEHWVARLERQRADLATIAKKRFWLFDAEAALGLARGTYLNLPAEMRLWVEADRFEPLVPDAVRGALRVIEKGA